MEKLVVQHLFGVVEKDEHSVERKEEEKRAFECDVHTYVSWNWMNIGRYKLWYTSREI